MAARLRKLHHTPAPASATAATLPLALLRRCQWLALAFFATLVLLSFTLWHGSMLFIDLRVRDSSLQNSRQLIESTVGFLDLRIAALRNAARFCAHDADMQEPEFTGFVLAQLQEVPGILAITRTDDHGQPLWTAPHDTLNEFQREAIFQNAEVRVARERAQASLQPTITRSIDMPGQGEGFALVAPIARERRVSGYAVGLFIYRDLLRAVLKPDLLQNFRIVIEHAGRPIYPVLGEPGRQAGNMEAEAGPLEARQPIWLGGQEWMISIEPLRTQTASPLNFVSLTILSLGLTLSVLLSIVAFRYLKGSAALRIEAHDSRRRLEDTGISLVEVKAELDLILNSVDEGIILYDGALQPIQANSAFHSMFPSESGETPEQERDRHHKRLARLTGSETRYWALFKSLQQHPEQNWTDELEARDTPGGKARARTFVRRATTVSGADGERRGLLVIYKEVTTIKEIERAKDDFLANVTHELRSPLAAIKGFAETLRRDPNVPRKTQEEFTGIICEEAGRLQTLIEELLDLRRLEARGVPLQHTAYNLRTLAQEIAAGAKSMLLSKGITLRVEWAGDEECTMSGDVSQISRALRNLLVNAIKYSPDHGEITLRGDCGQRSAWIEISDQGHGISEADLPHIFDKFYRGKQQGKQKGTGLGLAIVKHIVELHGGHLGVRSEVNRGTTFHMELPRPKRPAGAAGTVKGEGERLGPASTKLPG